MEDRLDRQGGPPPTRVSGPGRLLELPRDPASLPELPRAYDDALDQGLAAVGLSLVPDARTAIAAHVRLLVAWNAAINLTAITDPAAIAIRHVVDSLTALPLVREAGEILDLGSGGGFPGLPLAAALPAVRVALVESVVKKAAFLDVAVTAAGLADRASVVAARAEAIAHSPGRRRSWDVVAARGVADLAELVELAMPLLALGGRLVAWKRGDLGEELATATRAATALGATAPSVRAAIPHGAPGAPLAGLDGNVLVEVRKVRPTPAGYPRDPAARRRHAW